MVGHQQHLVLLVRAIPTVQAGGGSEAVAGGRAGHMTKTIIGFAALKRRQMRADPALQHTESRVRASWTTTCTPRNGG